ncbi:hypothetical protein [Alteromonas halophila]|uniref:hypothetical protein n=1 Tax=Alteromonas halophila TaxID=516698 RepID=UPI001674E60D|nr:hypothetical protein [Alteromonas halophila]
MRYYQLKWKMVPRFIADIAGYSAVFAIYILLIVWLADLSGFTGEVQNFQTPASPTPAEVFGIAVLTPLIENALLVMLIVGLQKHAIPDAIITGICGALAGTLHAIITPFWGITTMMLFFLMARLFLKYQRYSNTTGFFATLLMHVMLNTAGVLAGGD